MTLRAKTKTKNQSSKTVPPGMMGATPAWSEMERLLGVLECSASKKINLIVKRRFKTRKSPKCTTMLVTPSQSQWIGNIRTRVQWG